MPTVEIEVSLTDCQQQWLHHSHVLNIKGRSYRLRELGTALAALLLAA